MSVIELHQSEIADGLLEIDVPEGIRVMYWTNKRTTMVTITTEPELFDISGDRRVYSMRQNRKVNRQQNISGNARVGTAISGDVHGPVLSGTFGDAVVVGNISGSSGVAIGRGAVSVRHVNTGGGDYSERNINKRQMNVPQPDITIEVPVGVSVLITNY